VDALIARSAVKTESLSRTFEGGIDAVRSVDLEIAKGGGLRLSRALTGAGKSTTIRMLMHAAAAELGQRHGRRLRPSSSTTPRSASASASPCRRSGLEPGADGRELLELQVRALRGIGEPPAAPAARVGSSSSA